MAPKCRPMSCSWLSPWLMLSSARLPGGRRGIGDVNCTWFLSGSREAADKPEARRMPLDGVVYRVSFKGENDGGVFRRIFECGGEVSSIALVDCLTQGNSRECHKVGVYGCFHQDRSAGMLCDQAPQNRRNLLLEGPARGDVLRAFDVG